MQVLWLAGLVLVVALLGAVAVAAGTRHVRRWMKRTRKTHANRKRLWELLYGQQWGGVTTNNYGFAPAEGEGPERLQHQMYAEMLGMLVAAGRLAPHTDLLEVSCGRGGGLAHLVRRWPGALDATGLDLSENALAACRGAHRDLPNLRFVAGSALALPFADASFDVVLNVEASNDYGDHLTFFREVARVLRPGGAFLYTDSRRAKSAEAVAAQLEEAGLHGAFRDITANVVAACRADTPRRLELIRQGARWPLRQLFGKELRSYAAVEGSSKFNKFVDGRRLYLMTCAVKAPAPPAAEGTSASGERSPPAAEEHAIERERID